MERNRYENIPHLTALDEVKFVIGSREDYLWSKEKVVEFDLSNRCGTVLFSPIFGRIDPARDRRVVAGGSTRRQVPDSDA